MYWACFAASGPGRLVKVEGTMDKHQYVDILENNLKVSARELNLGRRWSFVQDNDSKHTSKLATSWFKNNKIKVLEWPAQSPDLNPMENLWRKFKLKVMERKPSNIKQLDEVCQEEWKNLSVDECTRLVENYQKRLREVLARKGYTIDY